VIFMRFRGPQALSDTYKKLGKGVDGSLPYLAL
jgi:hypothetical protein